MSLSAVLLGCALGIGGYTFVYARGYSYASNDPGACANCHVMRGHFHAWTRSSHHAVATCNDCHTPPALVPRHLTKARNGFWHAFSFTTGRYPDPIRITARNQSVTERACRTCHAELTSSIEPLGIAVGAGHAGGLSCLRCHDTVGHLE